MPAGAEATQLMPESLLVRNVMRIGVPTCKLEDTVAHVAALMVDGNHTAVVVLDAEGDTRGWINERVLAAAYGQAAVKGEDASEFAVQDVMDEAVPECPTDIPLAAAVPIMADLGVDHLFFLHHAAGRTWPASVLSLRDIVKALAGPEYIKSQGAAASRPTPMDLFRQRYGLGNRS
jgi:predicted transcriptional regulator